MTKSHSNPKMTPLQKQMLLNQEKGTKIKDKREALQSTVIKKSVIIRAHHHMQASNKAVTDPHHRGNNRWVSMLKESRSMEEGTLLIMHLKMIFKTNTIMMLFNKITWEIVLVMKTLTNTYREESLQFIKITEWDRKILIFIIRLEQNTQCFQQFNLQVN